MFQSALSKSTKKFPILGFQFCALSLSVLMLTQELSNLDCCYCFSKLSDQQWTFQHGYLHNCFGFSLLVLCVCVCVCMKGQYLQPFLCWYKASLICPGWPQTHSVTSRVYDSPALTWVSGSKGPAQFHMKLRIILPFSIFQMQRK